MQATEETGRLSPTKCLNLRQYAFFIILGLFTSTSVAQVISSSPSSEAETPQLETRLGQPLTWRWKDGREAVLKVTTLKSPFLSSGFKITDNTCSNRQGMSCQYRFQFARHWVMVVWTKHPEASKVGQIVTKASPTDPSFIDKLSLDFPISAGLSRKDRPLMSAGFPDHEIECEDFSWLPEGGRQAPDRLTVIRWDNEDNAMNPETGLNENRTTGGFYQLQFQKDPKAPGQTLKLKTVDDLTGLNAEFDLLNLSGAISLTLPKSHGEICQVGLTTNTRADVVMIYDQMGRQPRPSPEEEQPFILGASEILEMPLVKQTVEGWKRVFSGWVYQ